MPRSKTSAKPLGPGRSQNASATSIARRALAFALLALTLLPWYPLVARRGAGPAVDQTLRLGHLYFLNVWIAALLTLAASFVLGFLIPGAKATLLWERVERALLRLGNGSFALLLGVLASAISLWVALGVLDAKPALIDGVAQLVQARYLASGTLAGPPLVDAEFWQFQFMVSNEQGWVSQYPPGYTAMLALGLKVGAVWLVGPLLLGVAILLTSLVAERLLPDDRVVARLGALLAAVSPVLVFHAASYMNHVLALALGVLAVYAALRAMQGRWGWSSVCGAALGGLFATRPYDALVMGAFTAVVVWRFPPSSDRQPPSGRLWTRHLAAAVAGAAPLVAATLLYNRRFFGAATRFGYEAAEGPAHALGFHVDPWGNPYGPMEALAYTSADLQGLSLDLLQAPVPVVALVAAFLLLLRPSRSVKLVAAWALLPVAAYALYWHHDLFMGPRLLYEALPAWCLLVAAAAVGLVRALPREGRRWGLSRTGVGSALAMALTVALVYAAPSKLISYAREGARSGMTITAPSVERASLVFVHGGWLDRVAARLAASGMRVDSVRAALANNSTCSLQRHLDRVDAPPSLAFQATVQAPLRDEHMPSGSAMRTYDGEVLDPACLREGSSDFQGVVGLPPLLWQGDLPGLRSSGALFVRDFGPERNHRLLARFPDREPRVLMSRGGEMRVTEYEEGMRSLWSPDVARAGGG